MKPANIPFTGFTPETFLFFRNLKENNYKPWFDEHKQIYESEVLSRLKSLISTLSPAMHTIDSEFDFRTNRILSRIYRDIRFSHDKSPYKTCMWITFQRMVPEWQNFPAFFMEISDEGYAYGMGLYGSKKKILDDLRERIIFDPEHFKSITEIVFKNNFSLGGETYKRPVKNDLPEYFQPWFEYKNAYVIKIRPEGKELYSEKFADQLINDFTVMKPFYEFLMDVCD